MFFISIFRNPSEAANPRRHAIGKPHITGRRAWPAIKIASYAAEIRGHLLDRGLVQTHTALRQLDIKQPSSRKKGVRNGRVIAKLKITEARISWKNKLTSVGIAELTLV
jgi:hypothetical protein